MEGGEQKQPGNRGKVQWAEDPQEGFFLDPGLVIVSGKRCLAAPRADPEVNRSGPPRPPGSPLESKEVLDRNR